jgi:hypothetical protein
MGLLDDDLFDGQDELLPAPYGLVEDRDSGSLVAQFFKTSAFIGGSNVAKEFPTAMADCTRVFFLRIFF